MIGFYDGKTYTQFQTIKDFVGHVFRKQYRGYWIYAHFGGRFDFQFILDYFQRSDKKYNYNIITQGPKILALKFQLNSRNNITFVDSSGIFTESLAKLCKSFKPETVKLEGTIDFDSGERVNKENPTHQAYLKADCISLYQIITKYSQDPKIKESGLCLTSASQAMTIWKRTLKSPIKVTTQPIQDFVRQSYYGGRCEIFKMSGDNLRIFDVNSLYPYCQRSFPLPTEYLRASRDPTEFGFHDITLIAPISYIPILPIKIGSKLVFPTGKFRGTYFSEEIKLALTNGYQILSHHRGTHFDQSSTLFNEYMDHFYARKSQAEKDSAAYWISKHAMTDLYGKFGQKESRLSLKIRDNETNYIPFHSDELYEKTGLIQIENYQRCSHMLVHIASAITSYARIHMCRNYYLPYSTNLFYTDTDSIHTLDHLPTSNDLGALKDETEDKYGGPQDMIYRQPKAYARRDPKTLKEELKIKGFPQKELTKFNFDNFENSPLKYQKLVFATLKTSLIRNKCFLSLVHQEKSLCESYNKRRILSNGDTEPWHLKNGVIQNG